MSDQKTPKTKMRVIMIKNDKVKRLYRDDLPASIEIASLVDGAPLTATIHPDLTIYVYDKEGKRADVVKMPENASHFVYYGKGVIVHAGPAYFAEVVCDEDVMANAFIIDANDSIAKIKLIRTIKTTTELAV